MTRNRAPNYALGEVLQLDIAYFCKEARFTHEVLEMVDDTKRVLVIHGPNMNLLGTREPKIYGKTSLQEVDRQLGLLARELGLQVETFQSNSEGTIIDKIQSAGPAGFSAIVINPAGYSSTSVAIRDAIASSSLPTVEVHVSNVFRRELFRQDMLTAGACRGVICGMGVESYHLALRAVALILDTHG